MLSSSSTSGSEVLTDVRPLREREETAGEMETIVRPREAFDEDLASTDPATARVSPSSR